MPVTELEAIDAQINYLTPGSFINRRFVAPGDEANTGTYEPHVVKVRNARLAARPFTLDENGFMLTRHVSKVTDFTDKAEVDAIYPGEVIEAIKDLTGADLVLPMGWMARTSGDLSAVKAKEVKGYTHSGGLQPPAGEAHVDMMPDRAERMARMIYEKAFPDGKPYKRFITSSFWRTFSPPPQDYPLAVCDWKSVDPEEGVANTMIIVDKIPDRAEQLRDIPGEDEMPAAAIFKFNPNHRWFYYPDMTRDEALLFKFHDSDRTRAWRTPHTAFHDASRPDAHIRESVEFRTVAFFF